MNKTISSLIKDYFDKHPNKDIPHDDVVDCVFKYFPKAKTYGGLSESYTKKGMSAN